MAITMMEYRLFSEFVRKFPHLTRPDILELGEANWYGDVPLDVLRQDILRMVEPERAGALNARLDALMEQKQPEHLFQVAKIFYEVLFRCNRLDAIDLSGTKQAWKYDLNKPVELPCRYDIVLNLGTAEHVFNIAQFFTTVHQWTKPGGVMVHGAPFTGWIDHGFFNFNPTFFWDLARANGYFIHGFFMARLSPFNVENISSREQLAEMIRIGRIFDHALLYAVFSRPVEERPFRFPMQGYYVGAVSEESANAWKSLRG